jgi:hypothetical protein
MCHKGAAGDRGNPPLCESRRAHDEISAKLQNSISQLRKLSVQDKPCQYQKD